MNYASQLAEEGTHISTLKETSVLNPPVFFYCTPIYHCQASSIDYDKVGYLSRFSSFQFRSNTKLQWARHDQRDQFSRLTTNIIIMAPTQTNVVQHKSIILTVITTTNATAKIPIFKNNIWLHKLWQPCSRAARKWRENEEIERDSLSRFPHSLSISSLSIHFLYQKLSHFVTKC